MSSHPSLSHYPPWSCPGTVSPRRYPPDARNVGLLTAVVPLPDTPGTRQVMGPTRQPLTCEYISVHLLPLAAPLFTVST